MEYRLEFHSTSQHGIPTEFILKYLEEATIHYDYYDYINFSHKDRGHTKGDPVLGTPYTYIQTPIQLQRNNTKNKQNYK